VYLSVSSDRGMSLLTDKYTERTHSMLKAWFTNILEVRLGPGWHGQQGIWTLFGSHDRILEVWLGCVLARVKQPGVLEMPDTELN
jgi:hypothetical protein